jgi:hypothetical protein
MNYDDTDLEGKARLSALLARLGKLGWEDGRNSKIEVRWAAGKSNLMLLYGSQFVSLQS